MNSYQKDFIQLYEPHHEAFSRFCHAKAYGLVEAEDLISESILVALERFSSLREQSAFLGFLFSIANNLLIKKNRRLKFTGKYIESDAFTVPDESIDAESRLDVTVLYEALNQLADKQKEALILFEISGFSIREVAIIQCSNESAVKQRLRRGREKLGIIFRSDQLKNECLEKKSSLIGSIFL